MNDLNAPRKPAVLLSCISLTDEFRVLIGCAPKRLIIALERGRYMMVVYETMGVNDIPIP